MPTHTKSERAKRGIKRGAKGRLQKVAGKKAKKAKGSRRAR